MKIDKFVLKAAVRKIFGILLNDTIYCVVGAIFGVIDGLIHYFFIGDINKAIFWVLVALVCLMNLKETPK